MVSDVSKRLDRLDLARQIIRKELGEQVKDFSPADITLGARIYLKITRHNTDRLKAKLRRLTNAQS